MATTKAKGGSPNRWQGERETSARKGQSLTRRREADLNKKGHIRREDAKQDQNPKKRKEGSQTSADYAGTARVFRWGASGILRKTGHITLVVKDGRG